MVATEIPGIRASITHVFETEQATFERDVQIEKALNLASQRGRDAWRLLRDAGLDAEAASVARLVCLVEETPARGPLITATGKTSPRYRSLRTASPKRGILLTLT